MIQELYPLYGCRRCFSVYLQVLYCYTRLHHHIPFESVFICVFGMYSLVHFNLVVWILSFLFILPHHHPLHLYIVILHHVMSPPYLSTLTFSPFILVFLLSSWSPQLQSPGKCPDYKILYLVLLKIISLSLGSHGGHFLFTLHHLHHQFGFIKPNSFVLVHLALALSWIPLYQCSALSIGFVSDFIILVQCTQHLLCLRFHCTSVLNTILLHFSHFLFHIIIPAHSELGYPVSTSFSLIWIQLDLIRLSFKARSIETNPF